MTNIKELQAQIEALREHQAKGEEQIRQLEIELEQAIEAEKQWPQDGDKYYFLNGEDFSQTTWRDDSFDFGALKVGDCYRTKKEAEFEVERRKVMTELKKFASDFVVGERNYCIVWDFYAGEIYIGHRVLSKDNNLVFESEEKAQEAIKAIGEERVKKYILGVNY